MSGDVWSRWRAQVEEARNRHRRYPELDRQLDAMQADVKLRTWLDELTDEEMGEMLRGLAACIDAIQDVVGEAPERPEGTP
ncbi:hypothetical protein [Streptomyces noursei]|uniref:hypothetical protein n=1 Tax=Streptomyces noursei TaxID=1971 RepID=UPI001963A7CE|nr:hypothetical protein [Streptomyces noursei]QRX93800.1 hypothetical protein JNO44_25775 [Streptomyces noursei]